MGGSLSDLPRDDALEHLRAAWPDWAVWYIVKAVGGTIWAATRESDDHHIEAHSPDELNENITKAETGH